MRRAGDYENREGATARKNHPEPTDCHCPQGGGRIPAGRKTNTGTPSPTDNAHSDHEPEPPPRQDRAGRSEGGQEQPGKHTKSGAGEAARARTIAAARAAKAAEPSPENSEARKTRAPGKDARTWAEAPPAHDTKTGAPDGTRLQKAAQAARQPGCPARLLPNPKDRKEDT